MRLDVVPGPGAAVVSSPADFGQGPGLVGLTIRVSCGAGEGSTGLSAFDAALRAAGIANFNLVRLSSVIPSGSAVRPVDGAEQLRGGWGDRLYCVYAEQRALVPGDQAWAGIGWVLRSDGSGAGLFVEHEGPDRAGVEAAIRCSLADLVVGRPEEFGPVQLQLAGAVCTGRPTCAVVVASYETQSWAGARPVGVADAR